MFEVGTCVARYTSRTVRAQRTPHHQPHHELDALGAGLAQVLDVRDAGDASGSATSPSRKRGVELDVDQPGPLALELVRHAAGAEHDHPLVALEAHRRPGGWPGRAGSSGARSAAGTGRR